MGFKSLFASIVATGKTMIGLLGLIVLVAGVVGHSIGVTSTAAPWMCVAGIGLVAVAAVVEQARVRSERNALKTDLTDEKDRSWHFEQERDEWRGRHADLQNSWILGQHAETGPAGSTSGDVNQRAFLFTDPHQLRFPPAQEGPLRIQGFSREGDSDQEHPDDDR